jgi:hypothetical protein
MTTQFPEIYVHITLFTINSTSQYKNVYCRDNIEILDVMG